MASAFIPLPSLAPTYDSDGEDSDSNTDSPISLQTTKQEKAGCPRLESALEASRRMSDDTSNEPECSDYYDAEEDDTAPDIFSRQVLARKFQASSAVSKLVCDEVDEDVLADPSVAAFAPDAVSRALSRGKSMGGIRQGRTSIARSKSQFGSRARSKTRARGLDGSSEVLANAADAQGFSRGFSRRRDDSGSDGDRRKRVDQLNAVTDEEDFEGDDDVARRPSSIRFA